jgi:hypothetical protein
MNYPTQQSAQGLASLGRGNDSMLVHMTPREVQGLQGLAMAHGGSLTINPQTGLPEAGILDFVLPVAGSFLGMPPWLTASLMAGKTLIEGGDLGDAFMSGLTSYGGAKIGEGLSSFGAAPKVPTAELNAIKNAPYTGVFGATGQLGADMGFGSAATSLTDDLASSINNISTKLPTNVGADALTKTQNFAPDFTNAYKSGIDLGNKNLTNLARDDYLIGATSATPTTGLRNLSESFAAKPVGVDIPGATTAASNQNMFSGIAEKASKFPEKFGAAVEDPVGFARHIGEGDALLGGAKIGMYAASPFMGDMLTPQEYAGYEDPEKGKWTSDTGGLSFNPKYSTGLRLSPNLNAKEGGAISSYAVGGTVTTGGLRDLYGTTDSPSNAQLSRDGYGVGRLDSLAREQAMTQAQTTGYAKGGYLDGQGDGMSDSIPATIEGKQPARLADGEFVIPADVVSHLGNGSSKAGSKRLYAMLDKVRHARTGNKKQGKEIKPEKYMPA